MLAAIIRGPCQAYYYRLMVSPYPVNPRLPLGNTGRQKVRKEISRALRANPELRAVCKSVAPDIKKATKSQLLEMCVITGTLDRAILISQENAASQAMHSSRLRISTPTSTSAFVERSPTASSNTGAHSATSNAAISTSSFNDSSTTTSMGLPTATPSFPLWLEHQSSDKSFLELLADDISRPPQNF